MTKPTPQDQLSSISTMLTTLAAGLISIIGLRYIGTDLIAPILMAIFLAVLMLPVFKKFRSRGYSANVSLFLMVISFIIGILIIGAIFGWAFSILGSIIDPIFQQIRININQVTNIPQVESTVESTLNPQILLNTISGIFGSLTSIFLYFIVIPILAMLILLQIDSIAQQPDAKIVKNNPNVARYTKFAQAIIHYAWGRLQVNTFTGVMFFAALLLLGVDYAIIWAFLSIFLSFIPYIGLIIAGTPPTLIAFTNDGFFGALMVVGVMILINLFAENVLDPRIQGKVNKVSTPTVIIALIFWTWMLGAFGAIMAVPLTVLLKTILADYKETAWLSQLMEGNYSPPDPETKSYLNKATGTLKSFWPGKKSN